MIVFFAKIEEPTVRKDVIGAITFSLPAAGTKSIMLND
jgi:hypothetical protein